MWFVTEKLRMEVIMNACCTETTITNKSLKVGKFIASKQKSGVGKLAVSFGMKKNGSKRTL